MATAHYTFYIALTSAGKPVSDETLAAIGSAAWRLYEKSLDDWADRVTDVHYSDLTLQVELLDICENDVGVKYLGSRHEQAYGLALYTEQQDLELKPLHLAEAQKRCEQAFTAAAQAAGLADVAVTTLSIGLSRGDQVSVTKSAKDFEALATLEAETYWITSHGESPTGLYFDRDAAFASGERYVDAMDSSGKPVKAYAIKASAPAVPTSDDYTTEF
jgi:hypothetical protein